LGHQLADFAGAHKADVIAAADALATASNAGDWDAAWSNWETVRANVDVRAYLIAGLPDIPGLDLLLARVSWLDESELAEGLHGPIGLGPVSLSFASGALVGPPPGWSARSRKWSARSSPIGSRQRSSRRSATVACPAADRSCGCPQNAGFGGTLQLPLGPAQVDAVAVLERAGDGTMTFLAVMGIVFTPPIQLSFGEAGSSSRSTSASQSSFRARSTPRSSPPSTNDPHR
jgi:hypothetical protein